jgi:formate dehydrogenase beta subunit
VIGGGNTAIDCARSARRLGGQNVAIVVRSRFDDMKASALEKNDVQREGIAIFNDLVPKKITYENGRLTGVLFEPVKSVHENGRRTLVPK